MNEVELLKKELNEAKVTKKFYYDAWQESVKRQREIEELLTEGSLDTTNPPLFDKIMDLIHEDYEHPLLQGE